VVGRPIGVGVGVDAVEAVGAAVAVGAADPVAVVCAVAVDDGAVDDPGEHATTIRATRPTTRNHIGKTLRLNRLGKCALRKPNKGHAREHGRQADH
jgi:hypothetical protein